MDNIPYWLNHCHTDQPYALLESYGYKHDWIKHGDIGAVKATTSGKYFELDECGDLMVVQGVWYDTPALYNPVDEPMLFDVISWHPASPRKWYFLRGECGLILGEKSLFQSSILHKPLRLHATPFGWLKSGCEGSVILDHHGLNRLYGLKELVCEDIEHGTRLEKGLNMYYRTNIPRLRVPAPVEGLQ